MNLKDYIGDYLVSTVDLWFFDVGSYETMIFKKENGEIDFRDLYCERYKTEEEAKEGHKKAIEYVKNNLMNKE